MLKQFKIGHYTDIINATGCTVIIPPDNVIASASVKGASPGTRELALLSPERKLNHITALMLTGGSAFGLNAVKGVVDYLESKNQGYETRFGRIPIVPAAVIFDLNVGDGHVRPTENNAKEAVVSASFDNDTTGSIGAGTGATVGKWSGIERAMKGGLGIKQHIHGDLKVLALTVVNSVGDILGYDGKIRAGAIDQDNRFLAEDDYTKRWGEPAVGMAENTVLNVILTNALLTKQQAYYIAERSHYGIARRVEPSHTSYDGDVCFVLSSPTVEANMDLVANMAVRATEDAIINAIQEAQGICGLKSVSGT